MPQLIDSEYSASQTTQYFRKLYHNNPHKSPPFPQPDLFQFMKRGDLWFKAFDLISSA